MISPFIPEYDAVEYQQQFMKNEQSTNPESYILLRRDTIQSMKILIQIFSNNMNLME